MLSLSAFALLLATTLPAKDLADYQIGDKTEEDIVTPVPLTVIDTESTEALKQNEARQVPVVVRFYTSAADEVEERFRQAFDRTRSNFLREVEKSFSRRTLTPEELGSASFQKLAASFETKNKLFPVNEYRAALWASGDSDSAFKASLASTLRRAMAGPIRPDTLAGEIRLTETVRLVPLTDPNGTLTRQAVEQHGRNIPRNTFATLANARREFQNNFPPDERLEAKYLVSLLKPNCDVDAEVTQQPRRQRTEALVVTDRYAAGQVIAQRGQVIDRKAKAALDELQERAALGQLQQLLTSNREQAVQAPRQLHWLIGGLLAAVLILVLAVWHLARRRQPVSLLPMPVGNPDSWQERALIAEQRADKAQAVLRAGVLSQLARWLSEHVVQRLISQRTRLLETQQIAVTEITELEARLEKVHAPLKDRLQAYERRIIELEKELAIKGEVNRELIKAKIQMVRKQLETEREKNRVELN